jgi:hypothetical protein
MFDLLVSIAVTRDSVTRIRLEVHRWSGGNWQMEQRPRVSSRFLDRINWKQDVQVGLADDCNLRVKVIHSYITQPLSARNT